VGTLIDASVLIEHERGRIDLTSRLHTHGEEQCFLSVITFSELLHGVLRAGDPAVRARRSAFFESVVTRLPVVPVDVPIARSHAQIWADLASRGTLIGAHDLWLAATCIAHGFRLATGNVRELGRVPGLQIEDWTAGAP
jgi:tRNA(fMet)-specific endonuclease VapC